MADKRLRYYNGQFLQEQDFTAEQDYHLDRQRRHNRQLHTYGIAEGLTVTAGEGATSAVVSAGTAVDGEGRTIILTESRNVPFNGLTGDVFVVISYAQQTSDPATVGDEGNTRWWERPDVEVIAVAGAPAADVRIRLARLQIAGNNSVTSHDTSVRTSAGVKLGTEVSIERIRLARQGVDQTQWPVLSSGAAGRADVAGNLSVTGNITVTGTVDGRDISAEGIRIDNLVASTIQGVSNVGGNIGLIGQNGLTIVGNDAANTITFATGSPASIDGVSNPGGNIDLVAGNGLAITPDNGAPKRITIAGATIDGVSNPGGNIDFIGTNGITVTSDNTAKTVTFAGGSPATIDGVSNPGGNIDFVGQGGISITPDNTGKLIAFNTNPAALGALPAGEYGFRNYHHDSWGFYNNDADGATRTIDLTFQPKFVWVYGFSYCFMNLSGSWSMGGVTNGFARLTSPPSGITQSCTGTAIYRTNAIPYVIPYTTSHGGAVASSYFYDYNGSLATATLNIRVSSFSNNSLTFMYGKSASASFTSYTIYIYFHIFGA